MDTHEAQYKARQTVDEVFESFRELQHRADDASREAQKDVQKKMDELRMKRDDLKNRYNDMADAGEAKADAARKAFDKAQESFKRGFREIGQVLDD